MGNALKATAVMALVAAAAVFALAACNTSGCLENRSSIPTAEFFGSSGEPIVLDSIEIRGVGAPDDSVLVAAGTQVQTVALPMRSTRLSTAWCFSYKWEYLDWPELNDTVTFDYDAIPWFASEECGAMYHYRITRIQTTRHLVDSVVALDSMITNVDDVQLRIYFRTAAQEEPES